MNSTTADTRDTLSETTSENILRFGQGSAVLDARTGAPQGFSCDVDQRREYLIDPEIPWHSPDFYWGTGAVVTSVGARTWNTPTRRVGGENSERLEFDLHQAGLTLSVTRTGGEHLTERYAWRNTGDTDLDITQLSIEAPFNNYYPSAEKALAECVHAHVFAGGNWAWAYAEPMDGSAPSLGLIVTRGAIHSYSLQTQNESVFSNVRGHIVLNVTDHAIAPDSFGGQPVIHLAAGEQYVLETELGWYDSRPAFEARTNAPAHFSSYASKVGGSIDLTTTLDARPDQGLTMERTASGYRLTSEQAGTYYVHLSGHGYEAKTEVLFHESLPTTVAKRVHYILEHQVASARPGTLAASLVSVDTRTGLQVIDPFWNDWTDGSERICMAVLLQKAVNHGWTNAEDAEATQRECDGWRDFVEEHLLDETGASRRGSTQPTESFGKRLYDMPWVAQFYCEHFRATKDEHDLDMLVRILHRLSELGGKHFLSIEFAETSACAASLLREHGRADEARTILDSVVSSAQYFLSLGRNIPPHEVAYEQSVVAPLLSLLIEAYRQTGEATYLNGIRERLPWLLSFSGFQPDCRLNGIAIRHWDGHWFGIMRSFGDTFPHYWSALTTEVLLRLPKEVRTEETDLMASQILRENMANYAPDGTATCAFVFPSSVNGRAMNRADPLANDQDEHLNIWMRMIEEEGASVD
ncbi:hypothetical protein [Bifidobacterium mongoliense]|uniref:hypothetical protein n=1 Tax=Bifidobacterium mongoliense TaxID=518643 RepID=UPI0026472946|nr:hypothetical protein [Bifidobacterium mongoliense]MDN5632904.1 hypothetical protein [Bifidobacterium mongoliense]